MVHGLYRPWMRAPRPMMMNKTVIVNQQPHCHHSGGSGFWGGFLGGLLGGGLFSQGGLFSGMFGFGGMPMMTSTMPMGYTNPYAYLNQNPGQQPADAQSTNDVNILQKHFKDYTISERDGQFIATDKDGNTIIGDSFEDMLEKLGGNTAATEDPNAAEMAEMKRLSSQIQDLQEELREIKDQNGSQTPPAVTTPGGTPGGNPTAEVGDDSTPGSPAADSNTTATGAWERIDANTTAFGYKTDTLLGGEDYKDCKNADAVLQHHLNTIGGKYNTPMDPQQLVAQIVKNNPSVFNSDGTVKENADWSKLDLPNKEWLVENSYISQTTSTNTSQESDYWTNVFENGHFHR